MRDSTSERVGVSPGGVAGRGSNIWVDGGIVMMGWVDGA